VALLQSQLTDPGSKGAAVTRTDTVRAQYEQLRSLFEDGLKRAEQPFQTWGYEKPANPYEEQVVDLPPRK
jgi:hypothetical protein